MRIGFSRLERLFTSNHHSFYVAAVAITGNRSAAEDAVHDALIAVAELNELPRNPKAYLLTTIRNKALLWRRNNRRFSQQPCPEDLMQALEYDATQTLFVEQVCRQLGLLEPYQQEVLIMKIFADLSFREIAEILERPQNTVASWYRRGITKLKELLNEE